MGPVSPKSDAESPEAEGPTRKRRRTALACDECRERKRKCDGAKPKCGACTARSATRCVWNQERTSKGRWSNSYVDGLRNRIRELEKTQGTPSSSAENSTSATLPTLHPDEAAPPATAFNSPDLLDSHRDASTDEWLSNLDQLMPENDSITVALDPNVSFEPLMITPASVDGLGHDERRGSHASQETEAELDGMGIISSIDSATSTRTGHSSNYFGPASAINLLGKARSAMGRRCCGHGPLLEHGFGPCTTCEIRAVSVKSKLQTSSASQSTQPGFSMSLPLRSEADRLVESYWNGMHTLYPFLHWPSFHQRYVSIWNPCSSKECSDSSPGSNTFYDAVSDELFHCLLNVVFALGVHFSTHINQQYREEISYSFFKRAKKFLTLDLLEDGSIALVQTLLLMGQYLQTRDISSSCWNIVGLAIRIAQGIGLHYDPENCKGSCSSNQTLNRLEVEMYRRSWAGCVLLDRVLSLTYGRPLMVHQIMTEKQPILPSATDDELLDESFKLPEPESNNSPSLVECYVQAVKLGNILGQFLSAFYYGDIANDLGPNSQLSFGVSFASAHSREKRAKISSLHMLIDFDDQLAIWNKQLPTHLKVHTYLGEGNSFDESFHSRHALFHRQAIVLKTRFLHVRLSLLRLALSELCDLCSRSSAESTEPDSVEPSIRQDMLIKLSEKCVLVAREQVTHITENSKSASEYLPPPWYIVFYIHSCALVLLISLVTLTKFVGCIDEGLLVVDLKRCLTFLRAYGSQSRSAQRCSKVLDHLEQEVSAYRKGNQGDAPVSFLSSGNSHLAATEVEPANNKFSVQNGEQSLDYARHFGQFDAAGTAWMQSGSDLTWFSLAPFLDGMHNGSG